MPSYTNADKVNLGVRPAYTYFKEYGSTDPEELVALVNAPTFQATAESAQIEWDDFGTIEEQIADDTATVSFSIGQVYNLELIAKLSGGLFTYSQVNGTVVNPTSPADDLVVAEGAWGWDQPIVLSVGSVILNNKAVQPTLASVTGSVSGALTEGTDYFWAWLEGTGWAIVLVETVTLASEAQDITVVVSAYTPIESQKITRGGVKVITPVVVKLVTLDREGKTIAYTFHKAFPSGDWGHGFSGENSAEPVTAELTFNARLDTARAVGDQLMSEEKYTA